jgi:hypothetical protein
MPGDGNALVTNGRWLYKNTAMNLTYHRYTADFDNPFGRATAHQAGDDEEGWRMKTEVEVRPHWRVWGSGDFWQVLSSRQGAYLHEAGVARRAPDRRLLKVWYAIHDADAGGTGVMDHTAAVEGGLPLGRRWYGAAGGRFKQYADQTRGGAFWTQGRFDLLPAVRLTGKITYADYDWRRPGNAYGRCSLGEEAQLCAGWMLQGVYGFTWDEGEWAPKNPTLRIKTVAEWQ